MKDFPLNRFDFSNLIEHIQKEGKMPNTITDTDMGIEFYGVNSISRDELINFLENFNILDHLVQSDSKQECEKHPQLGIKSFQFEPSWVKLTPDNVIVGYVGIYINTDFSLTFAKINGKWALMK